MIGTHFLGMTTKKLISRFIEIDMRKLAQVGGALNILNPPKQKSQISLVFGMNALVPLGTM
ncbi:hypothetical protein BB395_04590 [Helicobacter pylori]|nr:hypothetical protein BB395_04590 [Helicobacter pylori]